MTLMKKFAAYCMLVIMVVSLAGCGNGVSRAVLEVDGEKVPAGAFNYQFQYGVEYLQSFGLDTESEESKQYLAMIEEQTVDITKEMAVVRAAAKEMGLKADKKELNEAMDSFEASFDSASQTDSEGNETKTGKAVYKEFLDKYGMSESDLKWIFETSLLQEKLYEEINKDVTASDEELQAEYDKNKDQYDNRTLSQLLVSVPDGASEEEWAAAKTKAEGLVQQLNDGADFATLAKENNSDSTKDTGGSLGEAVSKTNSPYVQEFTDAAFQLENAGDYTKTPVKTQYGYHIIKVDIITTGLENVKDAIENTLLGTQKQQNYNDFLTKALEEATVTKDYQRKYAVEDANQGEGENDANAGADGNADANGTDGKTQENGGADKADAEADNATQPAE